MGNVSTHITPNDIDINVNRKPNLNRYGVYSKDAYNVYYNGRKTDINVLSFVDLGHGYAKDAFNVYLYGEKQPSLDVLTFTVPHSIQPPYPTHRRHRHHRQGVYSKDAFNVYYNGHKTEIDVLTFVDLGRGYAKDAYNVYLYGKKQPDLDVLTFTVPSNEWRAEQKIRELKF